jgi:hypothetical protein
LIRNKPILTAIVLLALSALACSTMGVIRELPRATWVFTWWDGLNPWARFIGILICIGIPLGLFVYAYKDGRDEPKG